MLYGSLGDDGTRPLPFARVLPVAGANAILVRADPKGMLKVKAAVAALDVLPR